MSVTANMLVDRYGSKIHLPDILPRSQRFSHLVPLGSSSTLPAPLTDEGVVLFCTRGTAETAALSTANGCWVLVIDDHAPREAAPYHGLLLVDSRPYEEVLEELSRLFILFSQWSLSLKTSLLRGGHYQELLNCCDGVIEDFVSVTDPSFQLLAATSNAPVDDPAVEFLLEHGYHSKETVAKFRTYGAVQRWETQTGIVRVERTNVVRNPTLSYVFRMYGNYFVHVVLQCTKSPLTDGLVDVFQMLVETMELLVKRDWTQQNERADDCSRLLQDLISRASVSPDARRKQLRRAGLHPHGSYTLYAFDPAESERDAGAGVLGYYARRISEALPFANVGNANDRVVVLVDKNNPAISDNMVLLDHLNAFCETHGGSFGISERFDALEDIFFAFKQANLALYYGRHEPRSLDARYRGNPSHGHGYRFSDYFDRLVTDVNRRDPQLIAYCAAHGVIAQIRALDKRQGSNDLELLHCYLRHERRAPAAAQELHLHRNTLAYRMNRLQERLGIDLADSRIRQRILLEYSLVAPEDE